MRRAINASHHSYKFVHDRSYGSPQMPFFADANGVQGGDSNRVGWMKAKFGRLTGASRLIAA
jgi:hypothetical protein